MIDLRTDYLGLELRSPLVASAGPVTGSLASLMALERAGVGAVVLPSLFEEQLTSESLDLHSYLDEGADSQPEARGYFPDLDGYNTGPDRYLKLVSDARSSLSVPVIASLNATTPGSWVHYARRLERAGASAIELNLYSVEANPDRSPADVERGYLDVVAKVRAEVRLPLAVKLSPWFSSLAHFARRVVAAGADGLVLFNRFYQPDLDIHTLSVVPRVELSDPVDLRLPLRWIAILRPEIGVSLAASGGVHGGADAVKAILAGADVTMMTSALLRNGPDYVAAMERSLLSWMRGNDYTSVRQMVGAVSQAGADNPSAFERAQYLRSLITYHP